MEVVPTLKVKSGGFVRGNPHDLRTIEPPYLHGGSDPRGFVRHLFSRFGRVALVDYGGALTIEPNLNLYQRVARGSVLLWLDAFPETLEDVMDLFVGAAERVTIRVDILDGDDLMEILEIAEGEIWLGYPYADHAELDALTKRTPPGPLIAAGAVGVVLIDHGAETRPGGPDREAIRRLGDVSFPVYLAGGVRRPDEVPGLAAAGYQGVFVEDPLLEDVEGFVAVARKPGATVDAGEAQDPDAPKREPTGVPHQEVGAFGAAGVGVMAAGAAAREQDEENPTPRSTKRKDDDIALDAGADTPDDAA